MAKTTSYFIFGNKIFYPSSNRGSVPNQLSDIDKNTANIYKPQSYNPNFGTDFTNVYMNDKNGSPYKGLNFYYQLISAQRRPRPLRPRSLPFTAKGRLPFTPGIIRLSS
jgi:hypothetical protein